jgi:hypothetical protein
MYWASTQVLAPRVSLDTASAIFHACSFLGYFPWGDLVGTFHISPIVFVRFVHQRNEFFIVTERTVAQKLASVLHRRRAYRDAISPFETALRESGISVLSLTGSVSWNKVRLGWGRILTKRS